MTDADRLRQHELHGHTAKNSLHDDGNQRHEAKVSHPPAILDTPKPHGHDDCKETHQGGDHAVAVFIKHAALHLRHDFTIRQRPVRNRKSRLITGYRCACSYKE